MTTNEQRRAQQTPRALWEKIKPLAREMRHEPTLTEKTLWQALRRHQMAGIRFRRQHPIERFIADFYCFAAQLVIEVDGESHQYTQIEDAIRQEFLESTGLQVLRFTNEQVLTELDGVLEIIHATLMERLKPEAKADTSDLPARSEDSD